MLSVGRSLLPAPRRIAPEWRSRAHSKARSAWSRGRCWDACLLSRGSEMLSPQRVGPRQVGAGGPGTAGPWAREAIRGSNRGLVLPSRLLIGTRLGTEASKQ
jgi:hypothetical protein